ncbi:MAG TPA: GldG family protein [Candidatus Dormibacteraeota bacterium]|nr:GldG family protein [Candidatus Dormibacteraeota bacterium]
MTPRWDRRLALAVAAVGILLLLATLAFVLVDGAVTQRTALLLFGGLALIAVYVVVDPAIITALVRHPRSRPGSLGVLATAAVIGALVAGNVIASRSTQAADLTGSGLYTLSPRSVTVARQLDADLTVTGFFRPDQQQARHDVETLLDLYRQRSPRVRVRFVDPDQNAGLALSLGVKAAGSVVLQFRSKPPAVLGAGQQSESDLTAAILRLESTRSPTVCWATGDGERDLRDANEVSGYSAVADLLRTSSYRTQDVLLAQQAVPAACDVLAVLQLSRPLSDAGVAAIRDYLARGGKLLLALDPWLDQRVVASANAVLQPYGAAFEGSLVVEPDPAHAATDDATIPVVYTYGASPITIDLDGRYVFLPQATPITGAAVPGVTAVDLAATTDRAYAIPQQRTDLARRSTDRPGPFVLLRSIEQRRAQGDTRIVASGTSAMAENRTMPPSASGSNPDLLLASLDWLTEQNSLIAIGPKPASAQPLALGSRGLAWNVVLTAVLLPLLVAAAGAVVALRRRRPV